MERCEHCGRAAVKTEYRRYKDYQGKIKYGKKGHCTRCGKYSYSVTLSCLRWWEKLLFRLGLYRTDYAGSW